ncbi:MAG: DsbA family protein [Anaerolineae bacterium]|jgi:protein-disulfide isomerase
MAKIREIRERRRQDRRRRNMIAVLIVSGLALVGVAIVLYPSLQPIGDIRVPETLDRPMATGTSMGDPEAPVRIEEFSDFLCSHCGTFALETEPSLIDEYIATGQVHFTYRNFPLRPVSFGPAEASLCAAEQGSFWRYHDVLFANQQPSDPEAYSDRRLIAFADQVGLDSSAFEDCLNEGRYAGQIEEDYAAGIQAGVNATPTFFINGKKIEGALPLSAFRAEIEAALSASEGD